MAEVAALGFLVALQPKKDTWSGFSPSRMARVLLVLFLAATLYASFFSPTARRARTVPANKLPGPLALINQPSAHEQYYGPWRQLKPHIGSHNIVLSHHEKDNWTVASVTGAAFVSSMWAYRLPDHETRKRDVAIFFSPKTLPKERQEVLSRHAVDRVLLYKQHLSITGTVASWLGSPELQTEDYAVFHVK